VAIGLPALQHCGIRSLEQHVEAEGRTRLQAGSFSANPIGALIGTRGV
jgi:hypothetical protein